MISIGERTIPLELALKVVDTWLNATFEGGTPCRRVQQMRILMPPESVDP
jgi:ribose 5-phosphate isomerase RpiB